MRVVLGTAAVATPGLVDAVSTLGRVAVGLDVRGREVAVHGWTEGSGLHLADALAEFDGRGAEAYVITQIDRDGTLEGPDLDLYREALAATDLDVVVSGGIGEPADLDRVAALAVGGRRPSGVIVGRALYEGTVDLADAIGRLAGAAGESGGRG
jgi:phosphoribosylformimino-5-aminoimidazole carboxamide ribonucleotide (ProFAR) isomerase